jgi:hypothetical protein
MVRVSVQGEMIYEKPPLTHEESNDALDYITWEMVNISN